MFSNKIINNDTYKLINSVRVGQELYQVKQMVLHIFNQEQIGLAKKINQCLLIVQDNHQNILKQILEQVLLLSYGLKHSSSKLIILISKYEWNTLKTYNLL